MTPATRRAFLTLLALSAVAAPVLVRPAKAGEKIYTGWLSGAAMGGYDPVAFFRKGKPVEGSDAFTLEHAGVTWSFESAENRDAFKADPVAYAPQYGGHCAWAVAQGKLAKGDPQFWRIVDGKLYLNYDASIQKAWEVDIPGFIKAADSNWPSIGQE
jgi:YHS domain-containing protein